MRWKRKLAALLMGVCMAAGLQAGPATAIVGGQEADPNRHQFMAGLVDVRESRVYCGATLISPRYVLTAAHCVQGKNMRDLGVLLGDHDYGSGRDTHYAKLVRATGITVHEHYNLSTQANDIAVVRLAEAVETNAGIQEAHLPWQYAPDTFDNRLVTAMGWGTLSFSGPVSTVLQSVELKTLTNAECVSRGVKDLTPGSICTHTPGKDTCQYDSGGPLVYYLPRPVLVGIVSYGIGCAGDVPTVNTRVASYLSWILENTPGATYAVS
ncbi:serine protease [Streptomyces antibioticus]|uniref:serine protease n=1 Tax=Streptomyces antibioticus TaxID=1890 RepID=UPI003D74D4E2